MCNAHEMTAVEFEKTIAVNLSAPFYLIQAAIPHLLQTSGAVVNVTSSAAFVGEAYAVAYCATKAGLNHMTKALAMEYMDKPIRFNAARSGRHAHEHRSKHQNAAGRGLYADQTLLRAAGLVEVDDVADMIAFLASTQRAAITGRSCPSIAALPQADDPWRKSASSDSASQGGPMARRLIESGHEVTLWARRAEAYAPFADLSFAQADSVADLAVPAANDVGVCVVDDSGVRQVCDELLGADETRQPPRIHSTVHPNTVVALARRAAERGS